MNFYVWNIQLSTFGVNCVLRNWLKEKSFSIKITYFLSTIYIFKGIEIFQIFLEEKRVNKNIKWYYTTDECIFLYLRNRVVMYLHFNFVHSRV